MSLKNCWSILGVSSLVWSCVSSVNIKAIASEIESKSLKQNSSPEEILFNQSAPQSLEQFNSVSQLRDVFPEDWAYEALRSLTERYGCIVGFPNSTSPVKVA